VKYFLLVYRRSAGRLAEPPQDLGSDRDAALRVRFERERRERADPDVEVVVLGAASLDALKRTHARYFKTFDELVSDLDHALGR
jgi:hypothetical protein